MKDLIRRRKYPVYTETAQVSSAFEQSIFPSWYWEAKRENGWFYRTGYRLISMLRDLQHEQLLRIAKFSYEHLDITKPFYAKSISSGETDFPLQLRFSGQTDVLYDDIPTLGRKILDLGQEDLEKIEQLRTMITNGETEILTEEHINAISTDNIIVNRIKNALEPGEELVSGKVFGGTTYGRTVSFGDVNDAPAGVSGSTEVIDTSKTIAGRYVLLPVLTVIDSVTMSDYETGVAIDTPPTVIGRIVADGRYSNIYDIDNDGYISPEDINFIRDAVGRNTNTENPNDWAKYYHGLDTDKDGTVTQKDIQHALQSAGAVRENAVVLESPNPPLAPVQYTYNYFEEPHLTYFSDANPVNGGTLGADGVLRDIDARIKDGHIISPTNLVIGINKDRNELYGGRRTELGWALTRVARPEPGTFLLRGITEIDNVVFVLASTEDGNVAASGTFQGYNIILIRIDLLREAIEYTDDAIAISGITLAEDEVPTGIISTTRKDQFRIVTNQGNIHTIELLRNSASSRESTTLVSSDVPFDALSIVRLFNDVDSMAFNLGMERIPGEDNETLHARIGDTRAYLAGNDIQGMHTGINREIGLPQPILSHIGPLLLSNLPVPNSIVVSIEDVPENQQFIFEDYEEETIEFKQKEFLDDTVRELATAEFSYTRYTYPDETFLVQRFLGLSRDFMTEFIKAYIRRNPISVIDEGINLDERTVQSRSLPISVTYDAYDPDGVLHEGIVEELEIPAPSIDQLETFLVKHNDDVNIQALGPNSTMAKACVGVYALTDPAIEEYLPKSRVEEIIAELREQDGSTWKKTTIDTSFYDERTRSKNVINPLIFDSNAFDDEILEVQL